MNTQEIWEKYFLPYIDLHEPIEFFIPESFVGNEGTYCVHSIKGFFNMSDLSYSRGIRKIEILKITQSSRVEEFFFIVVCKSYKFFIHLSYG